jgi:hypothetical protein
VWIQFDIEPRTSIAGTYLKEFLTGKKDASPDMASALTRLMRKHEAMKAQGGTCHFVDHAWAVSIYTFVCSINIRAHKSCNRVLTHFPHPHTGV